MRFSERSIITAALTIAVCFTACSKGKETARSEVKDVQKVRTIRAETRPMERVLSVAGSLAAREQAQVSVKVAGRLRTLNVDIGSEVKKGEVIGQVDPTDYELRVQLAAAALAQARAGLGLLPQGSEQSIKLDELTIVKQARAVLDEATKTRDRVARLHQEKISSAAELDTAEAAFKVAEQRYQAALEEAQVRQATLAQRQAELDLAKQQLTDTNIRAPFDGVVQARLVNMGEFLAGGAKVITLVQINPLRLRLEIAERNSPNIRVGLTVRISAEGDTNRHVGEIKRVSPAISEDNRMLAIEGDVANPGSLRPGQFVRAEIIINEQEPAVAVPTNALIVFAGLEKVVSVEEGKARERNVRTGRRADGWVEIVSGLMKDELVIINPGGLRTGQPVVPEPEKSASLTSSEGQ